MSWDSRRKIIYACAVIVALATITVFVLRDRLFPSPTCFDKKQNGYESGIDCGGACSLQCTQAVDPLSVVFANAVHSGKGVYDLVAMINNNNIDNASQYLGYTFTLYDKDGMMFGSLSGSTTAPLGGKFPIIIQNLSLAKVPAHVVTTIIDGPHFKVKEIPSSPTVRVVSRSYEGGSIPRVYAKIMNTKRVEITDLPVRVLLFDDHDNVYAVAQTLVPLLAKEEVKDIIFTWNEPLPFPPTRIGVYPIFNPFKAIGY